MTDEHHGHEGSEEQIEDLEAPAAAQGEVGGGGCVDYTSHWCMDPTCADTKCEAGAGGVESFVIAAREL